MKEGRSTERLSQLQVCDRKVGRNNNSLATDILKLHLFLKMKTFRIFEVYVVLF